MSTDETAGIDDQSLPEGFVIAGRYRIARRLGKGGMGCVYLAADAVLGDEMVAIKVLHPDFIHDQDLMQRFLREVQLMRRVSHQNVVRTYDVGSDDNLFYFTMEYVPGIPLDKVIQSGAFPLQRIANLILQVAEALEAIHQAGIVHRDMKPGNVLLLEDFSIRITDFGVARPEVSTMTAHNEILGSVCYIAPEIWLGREPGPSVDLYSFGVILYELATGDVPFDAGSPAELMRLHLDRSPVPPKDLNPKTPPWLNRLILRLLEKSPDDRFPSGQALADHVRLHIGESDTKDKAAQDTDSFLGSLEAKTQHITTSAKHRIPKTPSDSQKTRRKEAQGSPAVAARSTISSHPKKVRSGSEAIKATSLQLLRAALFLVVLSVLLAGLRLVFQLLITPVSWETAAVLVEASEETLAQYALGNILLRLIPGVLYLALVLSLPTLVLALSCRAWRAALRCTATSCAFFLLSGAALFGLHLSGAPSGSSSAGISLASAAGAAQEQLLGIACLLPVFVEATISPSEQGLLLSFSSLSPILNSVTICFFQLLFLALTAYNLQLIYKHLGVRKQGTTWAIAVGVMLLVMIEALVFSSAPLAEPHTALVLNSVIPTKLLLLGALHWLLILVVGIYAAITSEGPAEK